MMEFWNRFPPSNFKPPITNNRLFKTEGFLKGSLDLSNGENHFVFDGFVGFDDP